MSKAQVSSEFYIFMGIAFLVTISVSIYSFEQIRTFNFQKENEDAKDLAIKLQRELLLASTVEEGYVRNFNIPDKINNKDYTLVVQNSTLMIISDQGFFLAALPKSIGTFNKGSNIINKSGGVIRVN